MGTDEEISNGAFLWTKMEGVVHLSTLLPPNSGWDDLGAAAVNDRGQIVGEGSHNGLFRAFLLTPSIVRVLDPNPDLIATDGNLVKDLDKADALTVTRQGAAADGVSKLVILVASSESLVFSIEGKTPDDLTDGALSPLLGDAPPKASLFATSSTTSGGAPIVAAVYTPPDSFGVGPSGERTVTIDVHPASDQNATPTLVPLLLARPPVVLVHGVWSNLKVWDDGGFAKALRDRGFTVFPAGYAHGNAQSFDPTLGYLSPGIAAVKASIDDALNDYHGHSRAATQADVVGHSMGGLMTRGLIQQSDYFQASNFNKGFVHRLITIGTPHHGSGIAKILWDHRDDPVTIKDPLTGVSISIPLRDVFALIDKPIDQGAVEGFINNPLSLALSNIQMTPVKAHAIVARWSPDATASHLVLQTLVQYVTHSLDSLEDQAFSGSDNDTIVEAPSQFGGLTPGSPPTSFDQSTIHAKVIPLSVFGLAAVSPDLSETTSNAIWSDVASLLSSTDLADFADGLPAPLQLTAAIGASSGPVKTAAAITEGTGSPHSMVRHADLAAESEETLSALTLAAFQLPQSSPGIHITSPVGGTDFTPGAPLTITAQPTGNASLGKMIFVIQDVGIVIAPASPPYTVTFNMPYETPLGPLNIVALAADVSGARLADIVSIIEEAGFPFSTHDVSADGEAPAPPEANVVPFPFGARSLREH